MNTYNISTRFHKFENLNEVADFINDLNTCETNRNIIVFVNNNIDNIENLKLTAFISNISQYNPTIVEYPFESYEPDNSNRIYVFPNIHLDDEFYPILTMSYNPEMDISGKHLFNSIIKQYTVKNIVNQTKSESRNGTFNVYKDYCYVFMFFVIFLSIFQIHLGIMIGSSFYC